MTQQLTRLYGSSSLSHALVAAEMLLRGFHFQDRREDYLKTHEFASAQAAATCATELMGHCFQQEFPTRPKSRTKEAGKLFMRAALLQDEIENWPAFSRSATDDLPADIFVTTDTELTVQSVDADPRWDDVKALLVDVCQQLEMDEEYATLQTRFWRYHGQQRPNWQTVAFRAHSVKIRHMAPNADERAVAQLARDFVAGVEAHDEWSRDDSSRGIEAALDVAARYYQQLFELV